MKKTCYIGILLLLSFFILGCKSFDPQLLRPEGALDQRIPPLEVQIDRVSLETAYSAGQTVSEELGYGIGDREDGYLSIVSVATLMSQTLRDKRVQQAVVIFDREISDNICDPAGKKYGYAVCRIANRDARLGWGWLVPSALTLFTINLFGFPAMSQTTELDVEVEIMDANYNRVAKYSAIAKDTKHVAFYWGYPVPTKPHIDKENTLTRITSASALRMAMKDIKRQIERDAIEIRGKLIATGALNP